VIVGGDPRKRGRVQAATADALALGVTLEMSVIEALRQCPTARAVRTDMARYRDVSRRLFAVLREVEPQLEGFGLAACYATSRVARTASSRTRGACSTRSRRRSICRCASGSAQGNSSRAWRPRRSSASAGSCAWRRVARPRSSRLCRVADRRRRPQDGRRAR
jgi:nucleotidyltransferase/DNA polymerase involved in DNA repair